MVQGGTRWLLHTRKSFRSFWPNSPFPSSGYWEKKVSDSLDQSGGFCPVGIEGRNFSKSFVQNRQNPPVGSGERKFAETVSFGPLPRLPVEGQKSSSKIFGQNGPHDRWEVRRDFFSEKADHSDGFPPVGIEDGIKPSGKDDYRYVRKAATGIKGTRCLLPLEI